MSFTLSTLRTAIRDYTEVSSTVLTDAIVNDFIEHAKVFNNFYGTDKSFVENKINKGKDLLFDIDWQGTRQIKSKNFYTIYSKTL